MNVHCVLEELAVMFQFLCAAVAEQRHHVALGSVVSFRDFWNLKPSDLKRLFNVRRLQSQ